MPDSYEQSPDLVVLVKIIGTNKNDAIAGVLLGYGTDVIGKRSGR
jgi:hypothetical protein